MKKVIDLMKHNEGEVCTELYDIDYVEGSVQDLKPGTLFGVLVSQESFEFITPDYCFDKGNLLYNASITESIRDFVKEESDNYFKNSKRSVPLILKKLDDNFAQELLSGEILVLAGTQKDRIADDYDLDPERYYDFGSFAKTVDKYVNNSLRINPVYYSLISRVYRNNSYYVINEVFKKLYGEETIPNKESIAHSIRRMAAKARNKFAAKYSQCIDQARYVALTENFLYDLENNEKGKTHK